MISIFVHLNGYMHAQNKYDFIFVHTGGEWPIFTVDIHWWISPLHQFARARTIDEYAVTMPVRRVCVTSQINCGYVTEGIVFGDSGELSDRWLFSGVVWSGHNIACKKENNTFVTMDNDFWSRVRRFANDCPVDDLALLRAKRFRGKAMATRVRGPFSIFMCRTKTVYVPHRHLNG